MSTFSGCSDGSLGSPHGGNGGSGATREFGALESDLLQVMRHQLCIIHLATSYAPHAIKGPGLLTRAMSVDILTSNYKAPEVCYVAYGI